MELSEREERERGTEKDKGRKVRKRPSGSYKKAKERHKLN